MNSHTLTANAVDPSGLFTTSASSTFTVTAGNGSQPAGTVTSAYDADGNVISRTWANGLTQLLSWDAFGRLIQVSQRDNANNGYDWTAVYDGLGRRLSTTNQPVANNVASGAPMTIASIFDPMVKFLEIGVSVNGVKAWKVNTIDMNERYGGMQGTGGLEAVIVDGTGATTGVLNDFNGNGVATITSTGSNATVTWDTTHTGVYGALPDSVAQPLTDITQLASAVAWRGHYIDPTGFYYIGKRYYEPNSGRWLSADPLGFAASSSLYEFCANDPLNYFDPDGSDPRTQTNPWGLPAGTVTTIQCHGVSAGGFSGNINDFKGLTTISNVSPLAADAYKGMANNLQEYGPPVLGKGSLFAGGVAAGALGGGAIIGAYEAGSIGWGTALLGNAALGSGLSAGSNTITQLIDNGGKINTADLKFSAELGAAFGGLSGGLGLWESSIETNAVRQEAQSAFTSSGARYFLGVTDAETEAADAWAFQTASNAAAQTGAIWGADTFGSPVVENYLEGWLKAKLGIGENPDGNHKNCGN